MAGITKGIEAGLWSRVSLINGITATPPFDVQHNLTRLSRVLAQLQLRLNQPMFIHASYLSPQVNCLSRWQLPLDFEDGRGALISIPKVPALKVCNQLHDFRGAFDEIRPMGELMLAVVIPRVGEHPERTI